MSDIEAMLNEAEHNAKVQAVKDLPTLPFDHEDCVEFDKCLGRCGEQAKKNGWLFYASHLRQVTKDGEPGIASRSLVATPPEALAKFFSAYRLPGGLAAEVYSNAVAHLHKFHTEIVPALNGREEGDSDD